VLLLLIVPRNGTSRVANSTVEYSAFNRLVPGSNPGRPIFSVYS
jgi:hypothetical protein